MNSFFLQLCLDLQKLTGESPDTLNVVHSLVFDELMAAILKIIGKLDLTSYSPEQDEEVCLVLALCDSNNFFCAAGASCDATGGASGGVSGGTTGGTTGASCGADFLFQLRSSCNRRTRMKIQKRLQMLLLIMNFFLNL